MHSLKLKKADEEQMRRKVDSILMGVKNERHFTEKVLPPCLLLKYLEIIGYQRIYDGIIDSNRYTLQLILRSKKFGTISVSISLSSGLRKGFTFAKILKENGG